MYDILYITDLAEHLRLSVDAIRCHIRRDQLRRDKALPPHFRIGRRIAWRRVDVDSFFEAKAGGWIIWWDDEDEPGLPAGEWGPRFVPMDVWLRCKVHGTRARS